MNLPARTTRALPASVLGLAALLTAAACDRAAAPPQPPTRPAAFYQSVGGVQRCYYVDDPTEVVNLKAAGLCPATSIAYPAPSSWEDEYWAYYSSAAYYDTYIPAGRRTHYTSVTIITYSKANSSAIAKAEKSAVYVSSSGKKVTGGSSLTFTSSAAKKSTTTTGKTSSTTVHGGGSARGASSCSLAMTVIADKSGTSGSSHGGGSARSGSSSGSSKSSSKKSSGNGAHGGC